MAPRLDLRRLGAAAVGLTCLLVPLTFASEWGWSARVRSPCWSSRSLLAGFVSPSGA